MSSKPTLYVFGGAIWPSAPWLAVYALGYEDKIDIKQVNLVEGANFAPDFLKLNPLATLPTLVLEDKVLTDTTSVVKYLVENAPKPAGKASGTDFIKKIHEDDVDPNFALLSARNEEELNGKNSGIPGLFIRNRQAALEKYAPTAPEFSEFYTEKLKSNGFLNGVYSQTGASEQVKTIWFTKSGNAWAAIRKFILEDIPAVLPASGYIGGEVPGEDDFHLAAWLARLALLTGATPGTEGVLTLKKELDGAEVPEKIVVYWALWAQTPAWQVVYKDGLH